MLRPPSENSSSSRLWTLSSSPLSRKVFFPVPTWIRTDPNYSLVRLPLVVFSSYPETSALRVCRRRMSHLASTVGAAVDVGLILDAVAQDAAFAMCAARGHLRYCAFEAIENPGLRTSDDRECFVVVISAGIADCHDRSSYRGGSVGSGYASDSHQLAKEAGLIAACPR